MCAITGMYSECRSPWTRGSRKESRGSVSSAVCKECVDGKVLGSMLVVLAVEA